MTPETAYKAIEEGIKKGQYKVPDPPVCPNIVEGSRQNAIDIMKDYIAQSIKQANRGKTDNKFPLLGTSGMAGIGKTTMLLYGLHQLVGTGAKGVYLSFNGNGTANSNVFAGSKARRADRLSLDCFGDVLMAVLRIQKTSTGHWNFSCLWHFSELLWTWPKSNPWCCSLMRWDIWRNLTACWRSWCRKRTRTTASWCSFLLTSANSIWTSVRLAVGERSLVSHWKLCPSMFGKPTVASSNGRTLRRT